MKKILALAILVGLTTSFCTDDSTYPCHPNGDVGMCTHNVHAYDYNYDYYGNICSIFVI